MKIGEYIKQKQPKEYKKLVKERKQEHLSFYDIDRLMRERTSVDETNANTDRPAFKRLIKKIQCAVEGEKHESFL